MNKLLIFPIFIMLLLTVYSSVYTDTEYVGSGDDYSELEGIELNDTSTGNVDIPIAGEQDFNLWDLKGALIILTLALIVGIVAGIKVLGSGLSETSIMILFASISYLGLWACLSIVSMEFVFGHIEASLLWIGLTIMFVLGVTQSIVD